MIGVFLASLFVSVGFGTSLLLHSGDDVLLHIQQLEAKVAKLESLETKVTQLETLVASLNSTRNPSYDHTSIAFMAQLSQTLTNPANGHVVVFDDVITNEGNAYNSVHGIFKAPVNGTFCFNLVATAPSGESTHKIHLLLKFNSRTTGYIFLDLNTAYALRRTTSVVLHMKKGDELWTEVDGVFGNHALLGCCFHSHLNGFLINAD